MKSDQNVLLKEIFDEYNNKLKTLIPILQVENSSNVKNILRYFYTIGIFAEFEKGNRVYYDLDAKFIYKNGNLNKSIDKKDAQKADMMTSFWKIYQILLKKMEF